MAATFSYSVVIRTLGSSGEKYRALIESIFSQSVQPEEVIVVIPEGYVLDYVTGKERIVYSKKGMVSQRARGILECSSDYMLVVDDDVEFAPHFVDSLHSFAVSHNLDCCLPMEGEESAGDTILIRLPFAARLRGAFTGQVYLNRRESEYLDKITMSAGHRLFSKSNRKDTCYLAQCGNFQCFFISTAKAKAVHFEDEDWLEQGSVTQYASYDDPTFFYKMFLQGGRIGYSLGDRYIHLDAAAGRKTKTLLESKCIRYYSVSRNRLIFWYKFLWSPEKSLLKSMGVLFAGIYGMFNYALWNTIICIHPKYWPAVKAMFSGYKDAFAYIKEINTQCL